MEEAKVINRFKTLTIDVIPVTAGLGVITDFSATVAAILNSLGCDARVTVESDISGLASAFARGTDAVMLADDHRFVAIKLRTRKVVDNLDATGRDHTTAFSLQERLAGYHQSGRVQIETDLPAALARILLVVETTPECNTIADELISD